MTDNVKFFNEDLTVLQNLYVDLYNMQNLQDYEEQKKTDQNMG